MEIAFSELCYYWNEMKVITLHWQKWPWGTVRELESVPLDLWKEKIFYTLVIQISC